MNEFETLRRVHELRYKAHGYPLKPFPENEKELRAADHGSPHDTVVHMARFHLKLAQAIKDGGLLK